MKIKAKRTKDGFLIPLIKGLEEKEEIEVEIKEEIKTTAFLKFLNQIYGGRENISTLPDEEALENELRNKYAL